MVLAVKSTALKVSAWYGFESVLLYPCLRLKELEKLHLDYLFGDGAPVKSIYRREELFSDSFVSETGECMTNISCSNNKFYNKLLNKNE